MKYYIKLLDQNIPNNAFDYYDTIKRNLGTFFVYDIQELKNALNLSENDTITLMHNLKECGALELMNEDMYLRLVNGSNLNETTKVKETIKKDNIVAKIKEYTANEELRQALKDFNDMRKKMKKPLTEKALQLLLNKLDKYGLCDTQKIELVNTSIEHSWLTIYEPKAKSYVPQEEEFKQGKEILKEKLDKEYYKGLLLVEQDRQDKMKYTKRFENDPDYFRDLKKAKEMQKEN